jgi:Na+-transporting NADH:ubiquinone oxidoreductase subunit NqrE
MVANMMGFNPQIVAAVGSALFGLLLTVIALAAVQHKLKQSSVSTEVKKRFYGSFRSALVAINFVVFSLLGYFQFGPLAAKLMGVK